MGLMRRLLLVLCLAGWPAAAQDLKAFEKSVTEFTLPNGLHFIVVERRDAPVVSFQTHADVGAVHDPAGRTGLAHMFEHMAFKGSDRVGSKDFAAEKKALAAVDEALRRLRAERGKGPRADQAKIGQLEKEFQAAVEKAGELAESEEFSRVIEENGGVGLNAGTGHDLTVYHYSLPSNRLELWFYLESERWLRPVFRDFYKERDVVREERRMRTESNPIGKLVEAFLGAAFVAHPYGRPGVGWASDIEQLTVADAEEFFRAYYVPSNLTMAVAGDVDPKQVRRLAELYFGRWKTAPAPPRVRTVEPEQEGERRIEIESQSQPFLLVGYRKPSTHHPDRAVFDVISSVLSGGRTGWFYKEMVRDKRIALDAAGFPDFPGELHPGLFVFYAAPNSGHTVAENEAAMYALIEKLQKERVDDQTLNMIKTKNRAALITKLDSNAGLAAELASNHVTYGNWRQMFYALDEINKVTAEDVQRVARQYFVKRRRTVAYLTPPPKGEEAAAR